MVTAGMEGKKWCGYPRKRVACCGLVTAVIAAAVITTAVVLTRPPDDIETIEKNESDAGTTAGELTVLRTAAFSSTGDVAGTLSLVQIAEDGSYFLAVNDFSADCDGTEARLLESGSTSAADTSLVVALTAETTDFTEPLDTDFDVDLYDQVCGVVR